MISSESEFRKRLLGTPLESCELAVTPVLDTGEVAFVLKIPSSNSDALWKVARELLPVIGRWPVVSSTAFGEKETWAATVSSADPFSRFYYREELETENSSPKSIISSAAEIDRKKFISKAYAMRSEDSDFDEMLEYEIERTKKLVGSGPTRKEIIDAIDKVPARCTEEAVDRFLLNWESKMPKKHSPEDFRFDWFYNDPSALIFLPTSRSCESLAYLHWFGSINLGTAFHIALQDDWHDQYGAELEANHGTMLQFFVESPPTDLQSAWQIANLHHLIGPSTLHITGISVRHYAEGLVGHNRWFFHERP